MSRILKVDISQVEKQVNWNPFNFQWVINAATEKIGSAKSTEARPGDIFYGGTNLGDFVVSVIVLMDYSVHRISSAPAKGWKTLMSSLVGSLLRKNHAERLFAICEWYFSNTPEDTPLTRSLKNTRDFVSEEVKSSRIDVLGDFREWLNLESLKVGSSTEFVLERIREYIRNNSVQDKEAVDLVSYGGTETSYIIM